MAAALRACTALTEQLAPREVPRLVARFSLLGHGGLLAQLAADEVLALFVPGLAGDRYPQTG